MKFSPKRIIGYILTPYQSQSLTVKSKAKMLAWIAAFLGLVASLAGIAMMLTGAVIAGATGLIFGLMAVSALYLLRRQEMQIATSLVIFGLWAVLFVSIKFDEYQNVYETYVWGTIGSFMLVLSALLSTNIWPSIIVGLLNVLAIFGLYFLDAYPLDNNTVTLLAGQNLFMTLLLNSLGTIFAALTVRNQKKNTTLIEQQIERSRNDYTRLADSVGKTQQSANAISADLAQGSENAQAAVLDINRRMETIVQRMGELSTSLKKASSENSVAVNRQEKMHSNLNLYTTQVSTASSAVEQMVAAIGSIGSQASHKVAAVQNMADFAANGEVKLATIKSSIEQVQALTKQMIEKSVFVEDVAERTNLLGLNASIEAAHAGNHGRGFAIVAGQIRNLSLEAGNSSRVISTALKETEGAVSKVAEQNQDILSFFQNVGSDIQALSDMIQELLISVKEVSDGSENVIRAVQTVSNLTQETEVSINESRESIESSSNKIRSVLDISAQVLSETQEMAQNIQSVLAVADQLKALGQSNREIIEQMKLQVLGVKA